jgi:glycosyltransferase involved in cell wall biosynthesis
VTDGLAVVIAARDERSRIARCLDALLPQLAPADEVILADDGSTDGTAELVEARYPRVRVLRLAPRGPGAARNAGWRATDAARVVFLDADAVPLDGWAAAARAAPADAVQMGRVSAPASVAGRLVTLLCFGAFTGPAPGPHDHLALLNCAVPRALLVRFPIPERPVAEDRALGARLARAGVPIRYAPAQAVLHGEGEGWRSLLRRQASYARRFVDVRRDEPDLPGGALLRRLGPCAAPLLAGGRLAKDLARLVRGREALGVSRVALPLYALALAALRLIDVPCMAAAAVRRAPGPARRHP